MKYNPLVSVIVPCYNSERYLSETIESVLAQEWKNIEIIVVDDGSADNSLEIARRYERCGVQVYSQKNAGACAARNLGYDKSKGDFIQYLDAEDILSPDKISSQISMIENDEFLDVYSCKSAKFGNDISKAMMFDFKINKNYPDAKDWLIDAWSSGTFGLIMNWLTPRKVHKKAGKWNESILKNQDGEFFCRVLLNARSVIFSDRGMGYYRKNGDVSVSTTVSFESAQSTLYTYRLYEEHTDKLPNRDFSRGIAKQYYKFIFAYYPKFKELRQAAYDSIKRLGYTPESFAQNKKLYYLIRLFGVNITLKIVHLSKRIRD